MPMIYVSEKTYKLLEELISILRKDVKSSVRLVKSDIIHEALKDYAKKLGVHINEDMA